MADVPQTEGVPPLASYAPYAPSPLLTTDTVVGYGGVSLAPQWGLYYNGVPVVIAESVIAFGFRAGWNISNYPIERGGFESYNRVVQPFSCRLQFAAGSSMQARQALLRSLEVATAPGNLTKYDVVTPELVYPRLNIDTYDYDRKAMSGAGLLLVDVKMVEIREQNSGGFDFKSPSGAPTTRDGNVQPSDVPIPTPDPRTGQAFEVT